MHCSYALRSQRYLAVACGPLLLRNVNSAWPKKKKTKFVRWTNEIDKFTLRLPKATDFHSVFGPFASGFIFCLLPCSSHTELSGDSATTRIIDAKMNTKLLMPFHNWYTNANLYEPMPRCCVCIGVAYGNRRQTYSPVGKSSAAPLWFFHLHFFFFSEKPRWKFICAANCASKRTPLSV